MSARKPKASGSQKRIRGHHWTVALSDAEHAEALAKVEATGLSKSAYGRQALLGTPGARSQRRPTMDQVMFGHAIAALNKLGSNCNQIARVLNTYGIEGAMQTSFAAVATVQAAVARLIEIAEGRR